MRYTNLQVANDKIEELEEQVRQLKTLLVPVIDFPIAWNLTKYEARILRCLYGAKTPATRDYIMDVIYDGHTRGERVIDVHMGRIRKKFVANKVDVVIGVIWGVGYQLSPEDKVKLQGYFTGDNRLHS